MTTNQAIAAILDDNGISTDQTVNNGQSAFEYLESRILGAIDYIEDNEPVCPNCNDDGCDYCDDEQAIEQMAEYKAREEPPDWC